MKKQCRWVAFERLVHQHCGLLSNNFWGRDEDLYIWPVIEICQAKVELQGGRIAFSGTRGFRDQFFAHPATCLWSLQ